MKRRVIYQGIFIDPEDVKKLIERQGENLPKQVKNMHCTFKYQPSKEEIKNFSKLFGKDITLKVVGYCSDGKNSGYEIELSPEQAEVYTNAHSVDKGKSVPIVEKTTPHITVSMQKDAKAVDTGMLEFSKEGFEPFFVHGRAAYFIEEIKENSEKISRVTYEPVDLEESRDIEEIQGQIK